MEVVAVVVLRVCLVSNVAVFYHLTTSLLLRKEKKGKIFVSLCIFECLRISNNSGLFLLFEFNDRT